MARTAGTTMMMFVLPQSLQEGYAGPVDIFFIQRQSCATEGRQNGEEAPDAAFTCPARPFLFLFSSP